MNNRMLYHFKRLVFAISPRMAENMGVDFRMNLPNRVFLEKQIFGFMNSSAYGLKDRKCLFVGIKRYNWHYHRLLDFDYYSIDSNPKEAKYGTNGKHTVGSVLELCDYFDENSFQFVIANGLIGFGINDEISSNKMFTQIHRVLKNEGILILGYNEQSSRLTFKLESSAGFSLFDRFTPAIRGLTDEPYMINDDSNHCYIFLKKVIA